jgi:hypothetical protein
MLGIAGIAVAAENPAAADLLAGIEGVRVRVYKSVDNLSEVIGYIDDVSGRLERDDWRRVVSVQDEGNVRIYIRGDEVSITGVTAMIVSDSEAVFVNVAGTISAQQLAASMANFGGSDLLASLGDIDFANP